jgi:hypothetical protein
MLTSRSRSQALARELGHTPHPQFSVTESRASGVGMRARRGASAAPSTTGFDAVAAQPGGWPT